MAEVYDPSNPYGGWVEDPSNTGAQIWDPYFYGSGGYGDNDPFAIFDPSNPYSGTPPPTGIYDGGTLTGDMGSNPYGVNFGDTGSMITPGYQPPMTYGPEAATGTGFTAGHGSLDANNPTQYPGSQWPNIGIGIPGLIGIGAGGLMTGGLIDLIGGSGGTSGSGTQQQQPGTTIYGGPEYPNQGTNILVGGGLPTGPVYNSPTQESSPTGNAIFGAPIPSPTSPNEGGNTGTIVPPPPPNTTPPPAVPTEAQPNTIYAPLWQAFGTTPPTGTNTQPPPAQTPPAQTPTTMNALQRNYLQEGQLGVDAMKQLLPQIMGQYGQYSGQPGQADAKNFYDLLMGQYGANFYNPELTRIANEQTMASNTALRSSNISDLETLSGRANALQRSSNPELYGLMGAYAPGAQNQLTQDYAAVARGGQLSPDEVRMAQQSAREAASAQGRLRGTGTQAAEVLNRFQFQQQRDQQNRANLGQSQQAALGGMGMAQAASFNPFDKLLGQGMNTQNVGTNQALFGQGSAFTSGGLSNQFTQQMINPYNPYANDVYGTNVNAANAMQIANSNNSAYSDAARTKLVMDAFGKIVNIGASQGWFNSSAPSTGTKGP